MLEKIEMKLWDKIFRINTTLSDHEALGHLAIFLTDQIRDGNELKWFNDPQINNVSYNESCIYRDSENKNYLIISSQTFGDVIPDFKIKKDMLIKIINSWKKIYQQYPDRIDLTQEDNKFTFEYDTAEGHQTIVIE